VVDFAHILQGIRACVQNTQAPSAFVFNLASRLVTSPGNLIRDERSLLTKILKASLECKDVFGPEGVHHRHVLILLCDKLNDLPPFLYVNNPRARSIHIDTPDTLDRTRFVERLYGAFFGAEGASPPKDLAGRFAALTEGLTHYELLSLVHLSRRERIEIDQVDNLLHRYKYGVRESEWDKLDQNRLADAEKHLKSRVKGQEPAIARVLDIVKRARVGLAAGKEHAGGRPRGVLFFAGPTGVGKTELAKSLAELLFGEEDRCIRFDMSEYTQPQSDEKLLGAPPGYLGYAEGGQLTNALKEKPFSILLFDEIEKAHGSIFDKFLQILDDGRLTDGKGETVYFSETIIIFTSNLGTVSREEGPGGRRALVNPAMSYPEMREVILESIRDHFNFVLGRPEILNRFGDNFVVFDFIKPPVDEQIVDMMLSRLARAAKTKWNLEIEYGAEVRTRLTALSRERLHHGGRGVRNVVDSALVNPLTRYLFDLTGSHGPGPFPDGARLHLTDLLDHGPDAAYQYEVLGDLIPA
jgi:MoxR-like ATPase